MILGHQLWPHDVPVTVMPARRQVAHRDGCSVEPSWTEGRLLLITRRTALRSDCRRAASSTATRWSS